VTPRGSVAWGKDDAVVGRLAPPKYSPRQRRAVMHAYRELTRREISERAEHGELVDEDGELEAFSIPPDSIHKIAQIEERRLLRARERERKEAARAARRAERARAGATVPGVEEPAVDEPVEPPSLEEIAASVERAFTDAARERERRLEAERVEPRVRVGEDYGSILALGLTPAERRAIGIPPPGRRKRTATGLGYIDGFPW
jgi:hypothetical protein